MYFVSVFTTTMSTTFTAVAQTNDDSYEDFFVAKLNQADFPERIAFGTAIADRKIYFA